MNLAVCTRSAVLLDETLLEKNRMATTGSTSPQLNAPTSGKGSKCVILVDDEKAYIDLLEQLLASHLACPVYSFSHASDALQALPNLDVGLIVTDYNMPDIDGLQLLSEVRQRLPHVPAVMITAYQEKFTEQQLARVPNLKMVIQKPFKWITLAQHISEYWNGSTPPFPMTRSVS